MRGFLLLVALVGCRNGEPSSQLPDQLIIDCVGAWDADRLTLRFYGNHPDYAPDSGEIRVTGNEAEPMRYFVDDDQLHLWLEHGRKRESVGYDLVTTKDSKHVLEYELRLKHAVRGKKVFTGVMSKSFRCEPRRDD